MIKKAGIILLCGVMFAGLCSCGKKTADEAQKFQVGVAYYNQTDTFLRELIDCFRGDLEEYKTKNLEISAMVREAGGSEKKQNDQVEELIDAGCDVLIIYSEKAERLSAETGKPISYICVPDKPDGTS